MNTQQNHIFNVLGVVFLTVVLVIFSILYGTKASALSYNQVLHRSPTFHLVKDIYVLLSGSYYPISDWFGFGMNQLKINKMLDVSGDVRVGNRVIIRGNGSVSTGLNADKLDGYEASDLLAAASGGNGEYRIYYACAINKRTGWGGTCSCSYPQVNVPECPPGWREVYYRDGLTDPGYTYYPGFQLISDVTLAAVRQINWCTPGEGCTCSATVTIEDGSGSVIKSASARVHIGTNHCCCIKINCGYRVCKKI